MHRQQAEILFGSPLAPQGGFRACRHARGPRRESGTIGADGAIQLGWMVDDEHEQGGAQVLLNIVLIAGDALVRAVPGCRAERHDHGLDIVVRAEGSRIVLDPELKNVLIGETSSDDVAPRAAAAWLVHSLVQEGNGQIQVSDGEEGMLLIGASLPA